MAEAPLELEDLLGALRKEGQIESAGSFTVDFRHAMDKLAKFQLEKPGQYALKLVQCAVASGATAIKLQSNAQRVSFRMEGVCFTGEELASLLPGLIEGYREHRQRRLRHLAIAVNSAIGMKAREISLECWDGRDGFRHLWSKKGPSQAPLRSSGPAFTEFYMVRSFGDQGKRWYETANQDLFDLLFRRREAMDAEQSAVHDLCFLAPVPISINGKTLENIGFGRPRFPGCPWPPHAQDSRRSFLRDQSNYRLGVHHAHHMAEIYRYPEDSGEPTLITPPSSSATVVEDFRPGQRFLSAVALPVNLDNSVRVDVVEDGVRIERKRFNYNSTNKLVEGKSSPGGRGGYAVVCGSRFNKDLSQFTVVKDGVFQEALDEINNDLRELRRVLRSNFGLFPPALVDVLRVIIPQDADEL